MDVVVRYPGKTEEKFRATRTLTNPDDTRIESTLINTYFQFKDPIVSVQSIRFVADLQI
jgi:hypothetical protein